MAQAVTRQKFTYPQGDIYDGEWNNDGRKHGYGILILKDDTQYTGQFMNGFCHGHGILKFSDGNMFEGEFISGKYHGYGIFTRFDGMRFEGRFQNGRVDGPGMITFPDGTHGRPRQEGHFIGTELLERSRASEAVLKAQQAARIARNVKIAWKFFCFFFSCVELYTNEQILFSALLDNFPKTLAEEIFIRIPHVKCGGCFISKNVHWQSTNVASTSGQEHNQTHCQPLTLIRAMKVSIPNHFAEPNTKYGESCKTNWEPSF